MVSQEWVIAISAQFFLMHTFIRKHLLPRPIKKILIISYNRYRQLKINLANLAYKLSLTTDYYRLHKQKSYQKDVFSKLIPQFNSLYTKLRLSDPNSLLSSGWRQFNRDLENELIPMSFNFINSPTIQGTMFVSGKKSGLTKKLKFLEQKKSTQELVAILHEDYVGKPPLVRSPYLTSHNSINHLYHLMKLGEAKKIDWSTIHTVIEWGGGYGNLAKIFKRFTYQPATYIIIDSAIMTCAQWLYLTATLGSDSVHIVASDQDDIQHGKINIVPLGFIRKVPATADLFISTWALNESSLKAAEYVLNRNCFNAAHLLLAYQPSQNNFPSGDALAHFVHNSGAIIEKIPFLSNDYYAFR